MKHCRVWLGFNLIAICAVTMMLTGCISPSIFHEYEIDGDEATSILIDAKQRAILAVPSLHLDMHKENGTQDNGTRDEPVENGAQDKSEETDPSGKQNQSGESHAEENAQSTRLRQVIVCAEPSPDALSVVSGSLNAYAMWPFGNEIGIEKIFEKSGRNLFKRNATIQLLRDGLYRQCEAYLNGVINKEEYKALADRYIDGMVALLAIERITPDPADDTASDSETEIERIAPDLADDTASDSETEIWPIYPDSHAEPPSKEAIEAVNDIARAFLDKNHVDKCINLLSEGKSEAVVDLCLFMATSKLSEKDRKFLLSNVPELLKVLEKNSDLNKETTTTLGTANINLGKATDALVQTNKALGATDKNLAKTTGDLSTTNEKLDGTTAALSETKQEFVDTLTTTNDKLDKATDALNATNTTLGATNEKLDEISKSPPKPDGEAGGNAELPKDNEDKTSQETNGQVPDKEETADKQF